MKKDFDLKHFLKNGAMFLNNDKNKLYLFYGKSSLDEKRNPKKNQVFVTNYGLTKKKPFLTFEKDTCFHTKTFLEFLKKQKKSTPKLHFKEQSFFKYKGFFKSVMSLIDKKTLSKAVPYTYVEAQQKSLSTEEKTYLLSSCLTYTLRHKSYFYAYFSNKKILIGSSPEIFFSKKRTVIKTDAIAGTLKNTALNRKRILVDKKLKHEQELVISSIKDSLSCLGTVKVSKRECLVLKSLVHIKNTLSIKNSHHITIKDLISLLHPTAALGSFPKEFWRQVEKLSPYETKRQSFGSPIGFFYGKTTFFLVAIRALECFHGKSYLYAGGGLTSLSKLDHEWRELKLKLREIKSILGLRP